MTRPAPRRVTALLARLAPVGLVALAGACGYDWAVRDTPERNDAAFDASNVDGTADAASEDGSIAIDAALHDGGADTDAKAACQTLGQALADARDAAQSCTPGSAPPPCQSKLIDECGCGRYLGLAGSVEAKRYESVIAQFKAAGCPPKCPNFCPVTPGACLLSPAHCNP